MATRASIGLMAPNGQIRSIYSHSDGYPEYLGKVLTGHYTNLQKINRLMELGDVSMLGEELEPSEIVKRFGFSGPYSSELNKLPEEEKNRLLKEYQQYKHSTFYGRDRGESAPAFVSNNLVEWIETRGQAYNYVFYDGRWYAYKGSVPINIKTGRTVLRHDIPGTKRAIKPEVSFTWKDADEQTRRIVTAMKRTHYPQLTVTAHVRTDRVDFTLKPEAPLTTSTTQMKDNEGKYIEIVFSPKEFYKPLSKTQQTQTSPKNKPESMKHIRDVLYTSINFIIQTNFVKVEN